MMESRVIRLETQDAGKIVIDKKGLAIQTNQSRKSGMIVIVSLLAPYMEVKVQIGASMLPNLMILKSRQKIKPS